MFRLVFANGTTRELPYADTAALGADGVLHCYDRQDHVVETVEPHTVAAFGKSDFLADWAISSPDDSGENAPALR